MAKKGKATAGDLDDIPPIPGTPSIPDTPPIPSIGKSPKIAATPKIPDTSNIPNIPNTPEIPDTQFEGVAEQPQLFTVNARIGLALRAGPDRSFQEIKTLAFGTKVAVLKRQGEWAQVDLAQDGVADGFVHASYLKSAPAS